VEVIYYLSLTKKGELIYNKNLLKDNKKIDPSSMKALYVNPVADFKMASINNQPNSGSSQVIINTSTQVKTDTQMVNPVSPYAVAGKYPSALQNLN
jgi:hypothetical protein